MHLSDLQDDRLFSPLDSVAIYDAPPGTLVVQDGAGHEYFRAESAPGISFLAGGALGLHRVSCYQGDVLLTSQTFRVDASTKIDDRGDFAELFEMLHRSMCCFSPTGTLKLDWKGASYSYFVHWILDHFHTAKGMRYFSAGTAGLVELLGRVQREDGMIWSFAQTDPGPGFFDSRDQGQGYTRRAEGLLLVRQPVENHCESNFVSAMFLAWEGSGDDAWMARHLDSAIKALDYAATDRARWSTKYGLLKRGYTIDSWDFQLQDGYSVPFPFGADMLIDAERTKFGVFFGDNTGYAQACQQLSRMLAHAGRSAEAKAWRTRGEDVLERLKRLAWNGRFFTHRVEEDETVVRDLGVDEKEQIAMSNCYSINRGVSEEQVAGIVGTYQKLREELPPGSPGEWYAIYPPFERGLGNHSQRWQYMNGGVHGHAAGELARGAFAHGFESYGADILRRMLALGRAHDGKVYFAYTGAIEPGPAPQIFSPVDIAFLANMALRSPGEEGVPAWMRSDPGNDLRQMPVGAQTFTGVPYLIPDPDHNGGLAVVAVGKNGGFADLVEAPIGRKAGAIYLLHTATNLGASGVAVALTFLYEDDSERTIYLMQGKHMVGWWFPKLASDTAGVAWRGANDLATDVGVCWAAIPNPRPEQVIRSVAFTASQEGATYALLGLTLADRMPAATVKAVSTGGPDNWAGATIMAALLEGLGGVTDLATAFRKVRVAPRWASADVSEGDVTVRYGGSTGYVAYRYRHDAAAGRIDLLLTGSGERAELWILLPADSGAAPKATENGRGAEVRRENVNGSPYAVLTVLPAAPVRVVIDYCSPS